MSKKKENTAVTVTDVMALQSMYQEDLAENLANVKDAFFRISIQGGRFKVGEKLIGTNGVEFLATVLREIPVNTYNTTAYDGTNPTPPTCWSLGGIKPDRSVAAEDIQAVNCASCKHNKFGSATDSNGAKKKGKACRNSKRLVLYIEGVDLPVLLSLPPTSVKEFNNYLKELSLSKLPLAAVVTKFSFATDVQFPKPEMVQDRILSQEEYVHIREYRKSDLVEQAIYAYATHEDAIEEEAPDAL